MKDTIYREDAIEAFPKITLEEFGFATKAEYRAEAIENIMALPSADNSNAKTQNSNQETQNSNGDLIYKADAIKAVKDAYVMDAIYEVISEDIIKALSALPSADAVPQLRQTDTLIIADALRYLAKDTERHLVDRTRADALRQQFLRYGASMCHSADGTRRKEP